MNAPRTPSRSPRPQLVAALLAAVVLQGLTAGAAGAVPGELDEAFARGGVARVVDPAVPSVDVVNGALRITGAVVAAGSANDRFALARFPVSAEHSGRVHPVVVDFGRPSAAYAVAQDAGHLVAAGRAGDDFALADFENDGDGDATLHFGEGGRVTTSFGSPAVAHGVARRSEYTTAVGSVRAGAGSSIALARYDARGQLDPSFGTGGKVVEDLTGGEDSAQAAVERFSPSRLVVAGRAGGAAFVAQYLEDGSPDTAFGSGGRVLLDLTPDDDVARALAVDVEGAVLVAGSAGASGFVARLDPDGAPDLSFGADGVRTIDVGQAGTALTSLARGPGGRIVVGGTVSGPGGDDGVIARFEATGAPDLTFNTGGVLVTDMGGPADQGNAVLVDVTPEGSPVRLLGGDGADMVAVTATATGVVTGPQGRFTVDFGTPRDDFTWGMATRPDGRLVLGSHGERGLMLSRLLPDGSLDRSFGVDGFDVTPIAGTPMTLTLQPDGRILVAVHRSSPRYLGVLRFLPDGGLDRSFGEDGWARSGLGAPSGHASIALQSDGRILVGGSLGFARLLPSGAVDTAFGTDGRVGTGARTDVVGIVVQPDGRVVVLLRYLTNPGAGLRRFHGDGRLDTSFHNSTWLSGSPVAARPLGLVGLPDGRFLVSGQTERLNPPQPLSDLVVARFTSEGALDPTFGSQGVVRTDAGDDDLVAEMAVSGNGNIVAVFQPDVRRPYLVGIARYGPDGRPDRSLGVNGIATFEALNPVAATVGGDGAVTVGGRVRSASIDMAVARFLPSGAGNRSPRSWGWNTHGQQGTGAPGAAPVVRPQEVGAPTGTIAVAAGGLHSLALKRDGTVWSWGWNGVGQLGDRSVVDRSAPVQVAGLSDVVAVSAGAYHSVAVKRDGTVWAWGWNLYGQLGNGSTADASAPVRVVGLSGVVGVAAGNVHSLALKADGTVWSWGWNGVGQLGNGSTVDSRTPVRARGVLSATAISAGAYHSLALTTQGSVAVWGWNLLGQLGPVPDPSDTTVPQTVQGLNGVMAVSGGYLHSLAVTTDGAVWAWGWNGVGQLGRPASAGGPQVARVEGMRGAVSVSAGANHSLALRGDGSVWAWGWNALGQLGDGSTADRAAAQVVPGVTVAAGVAGGYFHSLAF